jgi:type IV pilus assembly protein PilF
LRLPILIVASSLLAALLAGCATPPGGAASPSEGPRTASDQTDVERRARVRLELASAYFGRGQTETALDEVKQALAVKPDLYEAYNLRGLIYGRMNEPRLADESFRRALQLKSGDADTLHNYGWFLCQQNRHAEAQAMFQQALAQPNYRDMPRTLLAQGVCQARAGQLPEAERSLQRAWELDPANPFTAVNLTEVLYRRGEFERARFYIRRVNQNPDLSNAQTLWMAARIENKLGNKIGVNDFGRQLRQRFPQAPETMAFERGAFDE